MKKRVIIRKGLFGHTFRFIESPGLKDKIKFGDRERKKLEEANKDLLASYGECEKQQEVFNK